MRLTKSLVIPQMKKSQKMLNKLKKTLVVNYVIFAATGTTGLAIHMTKMHDKIEQLDGISDVMGN